MRLATCCLCLALFVVSEPAPTEAQPPKKKKPGPAKKRPAETAGTSFLSGEAIDLLTATSNGYELNGKRIAPALDVPAILKAARSKDARIQELGSLACELVYLAAQLRKEKPNEEVERIAQARLARIDVECLKIVLDRVSAKELVGFGLNVAFMDALIKEGRKRGELVKPSADSEILEKLLLEKPLQELLRSTMIRLVGQAKGLASKEKIKALVGKHVGSTPALRESIKIKLETLKDKQVVVTVTNQGMAPLHHCLLQSRAFPDPRLIERKINSDRAAMLLAAGFLGVGEKSTDNASLYTLLQYVLSNTERGALVYLPEIPAGGTVRLGLTTSEDLVYLKESELSLWCEELTLTKQLGTAAGFPPELVGTPFPLNDKAFASIKTELTPKDPRDPSAAPGRANVCKVYTLPMTAKKTYLVEATAEVIGLGLDNPPVLRIENEAGQAQKTTAEKSLTKAVRLRFTPPTDGTYRIVCTEGFGGPGKFTLTVFQKGAEGKPDEVAKNPLSVTVDEVEYTYQGTTRNGAQVFVTLLAKSKNGVKTAPMGQMVLVDGEGNQYIGSPVAGVGLAPPLRQGVPVKLVWSFGRNPANPFDVKPRPVPSAKIKTFASVTVDRMAIADNSTVEFRDVPAVVPPGKRK